MNEAAARLTQARAWEVTVRAQLMCLPDGAEPAARAALEARHREATAESHAATLEILEIM